MIHLLDKLSISQFKQDHDTWEDIDEYVVKNGLFLTYSVAPKVIFGLLDSLFWNIDKDKKSASEIANALCRELLTDSDNVPDMNKAALIKDKFAILYQDGRGKENPSLAEKMAEQFTYSVKMSGRANFHPKVYIVQYGKVNEEQVVWYRIAIGSKNLSLSSALEHVAFFEIKGIKGQTKSDTWNWLKQLLTSQGGEYLDFISSYGLKDSLPWKKVLEGILDYNLEETPRFITGGFQKEIKGIKQIFTPFITKDKAELAKKEAIQVYTSKVELKKRGFVPAESQEDASYPFYVYEGKGMDYFSFHYKIYICEDKLYTGSLNYTKSAFERNKEAIVELNQADVNVDSLKNVFSKEPVYYMYDSKREGGDQNLQELFETYIDGYCENCVLRLDSASKKIVLSGLGKAGELVENDKGLRQADGELPKANRGLPEAYLNCRIGIAPEGKRNDRKIYAVSSFDQCESSEWVVSASQVVGCGICFSLLQDNTVLASYTRHFPFEESSEDAVKVIAKQNELLQLWNMAVMGKSVETEPEQTGGGRSFSIGTVRKLLALPTLEELLSKEDYEKDLAKYESRLALLKAFLDRFEIQDSTSQDKHGWNSDFVVECGIGMTDIAKIRVACNQIEHMITALRMEKDSKNYV